MQRGDLSFFFSVAITSLAGVVVTATIWTSPVIRHYYQLLSFCCGLRRFPGGSSRVESFTTARLLENAFN